MDTTILALVYRRAGGRSALARALGIRPESTYGWDRRGIPAERVLAVAALTRLRPHELRPDLYPDPEWVA